MLLNIAKVIEILLPGYVVLSSILADRRDFLLEEVSCYVVRGPHARNSE